MKELDLFERFSTASRKAVFCARWEAGFVGSEIYRFGASSLGSPACRSDNPTVHLPSSHLDFGQRSRPPLARPRGKVADFCGPSNRRRRHAGFRERCVVCGCPQRFFCENRASSACPHDPDYLACCGYFRRSRCLSSPPPTPRIRHTRSWKSRRCSIFQQRPRVPDRPLVPPTSPVKRALEEFKQRGDRQRYPRPPQLQLQTSNKGRNLLWFKGQFALSSVQTGFRRTPSLLRCQPPPHRPFESLHKLCATQRPPCVGASTNLRDLGFDLACR